MVFKNTCGTNTYTSRTNVEQPSSEKDFLVWSMTFYNQPQPSMTFLCEPLITKEKNCFLVISSRSIILIHHAIYLVEQFQMGTFTPFINKNGGRKKGRKKIQSKNIIRQNIIRVSSRIFQLGESSISATVQSPTLHEVVGPGGGGNYASTDLIGPVGSGGLPIMHCTSNTVVWVIFAVVLFSRYSHKR